MQDDDGGNGGPPPENVTVLHPKKKRPKFKPNELEISRLLREEPELGAGTMFRQDTFSGATLLMRPIPRPGLKLPTKFVPRDVTDIDVTALIEWLIANGASKDVSRTKVDAAIQAEGERNAFSSAKEALDALPAWDQISRLDKFMTVICGAKGWEDGMDDLQSFRRQRYLSVVGRILFIGLVARIVRPGCKLDTVVIFEGEQGTLKSTLLRTIAFDREEWFSDSMVADLSSKDARQHLRGKLVVELGEMSQLRSTKVESLKQFISAQDDKFRPSYGRRDVMHRRQCVFIGTTNHGNYLVDLTGNRRFLPIACGDIDIPKSREWMPQLYAEAINAFSKGEPWWLPPDVELDAEQEQRERLTDDPWEDSVRETVEQARRAAVANEKLMFWVRTVDVLSAIEAKREAWDKGMEMRAGLLLVKLGGKHGKLPRGEGWPKRGYRFDLAGRGR
jgi:putative DNA primase/helicase